MRQRTSPIWAMPREEFISLVEGAKEGIREITLAFRLDGAGGTYRTLKRRVQQEGLNWEDLRLKWKEQFFDRLRKRNTKDMEDILVKDSAYDRGCLKKRLLENKIFENECSRCGQKPEWLGEQLILILDHINGINNDNRIENLRLLCPNCNSQMPTFSGRNNKGRTYSKRNTCKDCGKEIKKYSLRCQKCSHNSKRIVKRPDIEILEKEVNELGWEATGRKYGVSGNAIRKWAYSNKRQGCRTGSSPVGRSNLEMR